MHVRPSRPALAIASIRWERIQLLVDARSVPGGELTADRLRLDRIDGPDRVAPTEAALNGDLLRLRFNVMQGPGLQPLASGRWRLAATAPGDPDGPAVPLSIEIPAPVDSVRDGATFRLRSGVYAVTPVVTPDGSFELDVSVDGDAGFDRDLARRARLRGRLAVPARDRARRRLPPCAARPATRDRWVGSADPVHVRLARRASKATSRMSTTGWSRAGSTGTYTLQTLFQPERRRPTRPARPAAAAVAAGRRRCHRHRRLPADHLPDRRRPAVRIVQLWHAAGAFKTVGYSRVGKPGGPDPFSLVAQELHRTRSSARTTTSRSTRRRSASPRRASSRPASRGWTASSTRQATRGGPRAAA